LCLSTKGLSKRLARPVITPTKPGIGLNLNPLPRDFSRQQSPKLYLTRHQTYSISYMRSPPQAQASKGAAESNPLAEAKGGGSGHSQRHEVRVTYEAAPAERGVELDERPQLRLVTPHPREQHCDAPGLPRRRPRGGRPVVPPAAAGPHLLLLLLTLPRRRCRSTSDDETEEEKRIGTREVGDGEETRTRRGGGPLRRLVRCELIKIKMIDDERGSPVKEISFGRICLTI
jgi:hypothetical protein